jgi:hypothetical protein
VFRKFLDIIEVNVPAELNVYLSGHYETRKTAMIRDWLESGQRFGLYFTPAFTYWLNLVKPWFAALTENTITACFLFLRLRWILYRYSIWQNP